MLRKLKQHLTYANVMASLAVFAVLGGGMAVAAGLKKNSVKSKQIAANAVKVSEIADGSVTTPKLADNAATGAKVDESSLGTVPTAASAETAGSATTAQTADSAQSAQNATNAQNAQTAANAQNAALAANSSLFGGKTVAQVRPVGAGDSTGADDPLTIAFETVDGLLAQVGVPAGGGDLFVDATVVVENTTGTQASTVCRLDSDGAHISQENRMTMPGGDDRVIALSGFANNQGAGTESVTVECSGGSVGDNDVQVTDGDIYAQVFPIG